MPKSLRRKKKGLIAGMKALGVKGPLSIREFLEQRGSDPRTASHYTVKRRGPHGEILEIRRLSKSTAGKKAGPGRQRGKKRWARG